MAKEEEQLAFGKFQSFLVLFLSVCLVQVRSSVMAQVVDTSPLSAEKSKSEINVLTDCGAHGDGITDDFPALQQCIATHPGKTIVFPRTRTKGRCDFILSQTLSVKSYSTALVGVGGTANNNTTLCWTTDVTGIVFSGSVGAAVRNLNLSGSSPFDPANAKSYTSGTSDGVRVSAGQTSIRDVFVDYFSRHGLNVDSTQGEQADIWIFENVRSEHNRGDGFHFVGQDANAGLCLMCIARLNQGWGFYNQAVIPSTYIAPLTDGNHNDPTKPRETVPVSRVTVANGVATVTTTIPHQTIAGDWGLIQGCPAFGSKAAILSVPSSTTLQIPTGNADGVYCETHSATFGFQSGARVWATGRTVSDMETKAGSNSVTSVTAHWTASDYGTLVCIEKAGPDGGELCSNIRFISGNSAMLAVPANS